jgi:hypothetical protein
MDVVLRDRGEQRHRGAQPNRSGGEVGVLDAVLGQRRVGLRAAIGAEAGQFSKALPAEQILQRMEHG